MRPIIVTEFVSLDGVMEHPAWTMPYWNDEIAQLKDEEQQISDAMLLGRVTYEGFAAAWPESEDEVAAWMNNTPKYVASTTLDTVTWRNSHLLKGDVVAEIAQLKQQAGQGLLVYGSAMLVQTLMQHDLVDSYRLLVYPVVLGKGKRLFADGVTATLKLVQTQSFSSGVTGLIYTPERG